MLDSEEPVELWRVRVEWRETESGWIPPWSPRLCSLIELLWQCFSIIKGFQLEPVFPAPRRSQSSGVTAQNMGRKRTQPPGSKDRALLSAAAARPCSPTGRTQSHGMGRMEVVGGGGHLGSQYYGKVAQHCIKIANCKNYEDLDLENVPPF